jgi:uncharacterized protein
LGTSGHTIRTKTPASGLKNYGFVVTLRRTLEQDKRFEWDDAKNAANLRKHKVSFETACEVFDDPLHRSVADRTEDGEQRWNTTGMVGGVVLLIVAHLWRDDRDGETIRIISARKATRKERRDYENG